MEKIGIVLPVTTLAGGSLILPLVYGVGTAVPVLAVAFVLAFSAPSLGRAYAVLSKVAWWARMITGVVFLVIGIYFCMRFVYLAA